jgi:membrane protein required for colicin V production
MHTLDILFIIAGAFFIFIGIRRGLIGELFRLAALIAGFFAAFLYYEEIASYFRFTSPVIDRACAFTLVFLIVAIAIIGVGWVVKKIIHLTPLGWIDGLFGGIIGLTKTILIFWILCLSLSSFPLSRPMLDANRSVLFQTYKRLPSSVKLDGITAMRNRLKKNVGGDLQRTIKHALQQIESLKEKIDSAEKNEFKKR